MALARPEGTYARARERLVLGNLAIDAGGRRVYVDGRYVDLTTRDFDLALLLAHHAGHVLSYRTITLALFGETGVPETRHLSVIVHRLRAKLGRTIPYAIETVRGRGYGLLEIPVAPRDGSNIASLAEGR